MEAALIIFGIAIVAFFVFLYWKFWMNINNYSSRHFEFEPLGFWSTFFATLAVVGIYLGYYLIDDAGGIPPLPWTEEILSSKAINGLVICFTGGIIGLILYFYLVRNSSLLVGTLGMVLLAIAGHFFFILLILIFFIICGLSDRRQSRRVVVYRD